MVIFDQSPVGGEDRREESGLEPKFACNCGNGGGIRGSLFHFKKSAPSIDKASRPVNERTKKKISGALLNGDETRRLPGNVNFCFPDTEAEGLLLLLDNKGICASSRSACTSGFLDPSHVLLAIGRDKETARGSLRLTLDCENTPEEVETIIEAVTDTVRILRGC